MGRLHGQQRRSSPRQEHPEMKLRKRASKRTGTAQREKIRKKVREHQRKSRRDAKKDPTWRTKKKQDPGIPNSFPYKEQLLNEIEQRRAQAEIERDALKESRLNGGGEDDEMDDEREFASAQEENGATDEEDEEEIGEAARYTGSLTQFRSQHYGAKSKPRVLITVYVLDGRDPASWQISDLKKSFAVSKKEEVVFALSRADLVPREQLAAWIAHLSNTHPSFAICSPTPAANGIPARTGAGLERLSEHILSTVKGKKRKTDAESDAIAVVGLQNSGRTTLADALSGLLPDLTVFDTPALVAASASQANDEDAIDEDDDDEDYEEMTKKRDLQAAHRILVRNAGGIFKIHEPLPLIDALVSRVAFEADLMMAYNTPAFASTNDFLIGVARTTGRLKNGTTPDCVAAARTVLHQWSTGVIGYYAKAPAAKSDEEKKRVELAKKELEADESLTDVVLPRKAWQAKFQGREIRLSSQASEQGGMLGASPVAFAKVQAASDDEEDEGDEEEDDDEEDEDVDIDDEEDDEDE